MNTKGPRAVKARAAFSRLDAGRTFTVRQIDDDRYPLATHHLNFDNNDVLWYTVPVRPRAAFHVEGGKGDDQQAGEIPGEAEPASEVPPLPRHSEARRLVTGRCR